MRLPHLVVASGWATLQLSAVYGHCFQAHLPGVDVQLFDLIGPWPARAGSPFLEIGARYERLCRGHHLHVAEIVDRVVAHRAGEDGQMG